MSKTSDIININFTVDIHQEKANQRFLLAMYEIIALQQEDVKNITHFCNVSGIHKNRISLIRSKKTDINLDDVIKLCARFAYSSDYIIFGIGSKTPVNPK